MASERAEHLTLAQKEQLETELAELEGPKRAEIVEAIATARGFGDLSENFEYHAAKNEQGLLERRITILRSRLDSAVLIDEAAVAASDTCPSARRSRSRTRRASACEVEISSVGGVSPESPLGRALLGEKQGDEVDVPAPRGAVARESRLGRPLATARSPARHGRRDTLSLTVPGTEKVGVCRDVTSCDGAWHRDMAARDMSALVGVEALSRSSLAERGEGLLRSASLRPGVTLL